MRMRGQAIVVTVGVGVGLVLFGCTPDADPTDPATAQPTATSTPTPTPSPTPSPTLDVTAPPERPEAMATLDADGAAAAASYFISLYPYVYATGDLTTWNEFSAPDCVFCSSTRDGATGVHDKGHRLEGGAITIDSADGTEVDAGRWYSATLLTSEAASVEYDANGGVVDETPGARHQIFVALSVESGAWVVDGVEVRPAQ